MLPPNRMSPLTNGDTEVARMLLGEAELKDDLSGELFRSPFRGVVLPFLDKKSLEIPGATEVGVAGE